MLKYKEPKNNNVNIENEICFIFRPLPPTPLEEETTPLKEEKRKVLKGLNNKNIASNNVSDQFVYTLTII